MPYTKIWIHLVWATKGGQPLLKKEIRQQIFDHIKENAHAKGIFLDQINGHIDHVHCLVSLMATQNIANAVKLLKGGSSYWINKNQLIKTKFG